MPIYDYVCSNCGQTTEVIHGIDAPGPRFCPSCGAESTLRKAFVAPTVVFKGSGWAKKDRSASSASGTKAKAGAETGAKSDGEGPKATDASGSPSTSSSSTGTSGSSKSGSSGSSGDASAGSGSAATSGGD